MQRTTSHTVTVAVNFEGKMSWGNFYEKGRPSGHPAMCEADTQHAAGEKEEKELNEQLIVPMITLDDK